MNIRKTTISLDMERFTEDNKGIEKAIFRMIRYAPTFYDTVSIYHDGKGQDIVAVFFKDEVRRFVMGGVYHDTTKEYSYHS